MSSSLRLLPRNLFVRSFSSGVPLKYPKFHRGIGWPAEQVSKPDEDPTSFYSMEALELSQDLDIPILDPVPVPKNATRVARLSMEGYMDDHIDFYSYFAKYAATAMKIPTSPVEKPLPDVKRIRVNKSPFVHGKSREVYQVRTYRYSIDVYNADEDLVDRWVWYVKQHAPPSIRLIHDKWTQHEFGFGEKQLKEAQAILKDRDSRRGIPEKSQPS